MRKSSIKRKSAWTAESGRAERAGEDQPDIAPPCAHSGGQHPVGHQKAVCFVGQHPVGVQKAVCFAGQHPVEVKKAARFAPFRAARRKRRPVLHRSRLRGEKGGLFFTVPGCAAQKAARFSPFLTARRKRRPVLHSATPRGCCFGPSFRADYKTKPDTPWKSHRVPGKLRWRPKTPRQILLWWPQTPRTDSQASADVLGGALGLSSEVRSGLREQVVLERLEGVRHRHTAFLALHKGTEPLGDLDRATRGRLHRVEELGRVSRLKEDARLARL